MTSFATRQPGDTQVALSVAELGRLVRRRTCEAVALHFASIALDQTAAASARPAQLDSIGAEERG